tara:strand:- start:51 stop:764 length:714 start_codon:yes stop_codon:yes gene_type:complete
MKEEWRTVVVHGKEYPRYSISNFGNVRSYAKGKLKNLVIERKKRADGSLAYCNIQLRFPKDFFEDYQYAKSSKSSSTVQKNCSIHELVMEAFRPMDDYPPDRLKEDWNDIPESAKTWIKETVTIDHIDHDPSNNRLDNLRYVTQRENTRAAVKHYGGNVANKKKQSDDEFMIFTEPKFNMLFQEWEDGKVEFHGEEGEECYNMLIDISKDRGISPGDAFWEVIRDGIERDKKALKME